MDRSSFDVERTEVATIKVRRNYCGAAVFKNGIAVGGGWSQDASKSS